MIIFQYLLAPCSISMNEIIELEKVLGLVMRVLVPRSEKLLANAGVEHGLFIGICGTFH